MPVTGDRGQAVILAARRGQPPPVARAHQCLIQLAFDHGLDETAHPIAHPSFDRIEPIVEKIHSWFAGTGCEDSDFVITFFMAWSPI